MAIVSPLRRSVEKRQLAPGPVRYTSFVTLTRGGSGQWYLEMCIGPTWNNKKWLSCLLVFCCCCYVFVRRGLFFLTTAVGVYPVM